MPHSLPLVSIGAGIVWLGWNGFNGGDPYFASADAATAVVNTNLATVAALLTWVLWDMFLEQGEEADVPRRRQRHDRRPGGHHPGRRLRQRARAPCSSGIIASASSGSPGPTSSRSSCSKVDDAMGVVYTHGIAGLCGGLLVGIFADPSVVVYPQTTTRHAVRCDRLAVRQPTPVLRCSCSPALTIIVWDAL